MPEAKPFGISKHLVFKAYRLVRANHGAAGVDRQSVEAFEADLKGNLYKIWNRMSSGSYFAPPVRLVEIPKGDGGMRPLGIPTVADRIAQMVAKLTLESLVEPVFHPDSYGYRPGKSALDAVGAARKRCLRMDWVIDLDIRDFFGSLDHDRMMRAVKHHTDLKWIHLYVERWLTAPSIGGRLEETAASMQEALQRALKLPSPADQLTWSDPDDDHTTGRARLCAKVAGFSLHAGQAVAADDREGLERLCRYGLRAPFSQERLSLTDSGEVVYTLPRPWPNASGVTELVMAPTEFLKRLAALIPSPGTHLIAVPRRVREPVAVSEAGTGASGAGANGAGGSGGAAGVAVERGRTGRWRAQPTPTALVGAAVGAGVPDRRPALPGVRRPPTDRVVSDGSERGAADPDASQASDRSAGGEAGADAPRDGADVRVRR